MFLNFYLISLGASLIIVLALSIYAWQNVRYPGAHAFSVLMLLEAAWIMTALSAPFDNDLHSRVLWIQIRLSLTSFLAVAWLITIIQYTGNGRWLKRRNMSLLFFFPVLLLFFIWTLPYHELYRYNFRLAFNGSFNTLLWEVGPMNRLQTLFDYSVAYFASYALLVVHLRREHARYFKRSLLLILAASILAVPEFIYFVAPQLLGGVNITANFFGVAGLIIAGAIFRGQMFSLMPIAHSTLFANMRDGLLVVDLKRIIVDLNQAARRMLQIQEDATGLPLERLLSTEELLAAGACEIQVADADGDLKIYEVHLSPLEDERRRQIGHMVSLRDITSRKRSEEIMRLQVATLEAAANAIAIFDADGHFIWLNPAFTRLTGYTLAEVSGQLMRLLLADIVSAEQKATMWQTVQAGQVWHGQWIGRRKDGSLYPEEQTVTPLLDAGGKITHLISIKQDISERQALETLRQDLTQMMVHDLRSPLSQITLSASFLSNRILPEDREIIQIVQQGAERLEAMLGDILDLSRLENRQMPLSLAAVNLEALLDDVIQAHLPQAHQRKISLTKANSVSQNTDGAFMAWADAALMQRVLRNLVGNALKFTPAGKQITCQVSAANGNLRVSLQDGGEGITPELLPQLFQKFVTARRQGSGTGLGLAFCRLAIEAHGGRIWAENAPQGGAIFSFELPRAGDPPGTMP